MPAAITIEKLVGAVIAPVPKSAPNRFKEALQSGRFSNRDSSPMTPRLKVRTQATKIAP